MGNRRISTVQATMLDCDHSIGILVTYGDKRETFRIPNPFSGEIDTEWREDHPNLNHNADGPPGPQPGGLMQAFEAWRKRAN